MVLDVFENFSKVVYSDKMKFLSILPGWTRMQRRISVIICRNRPWSTPDNSGLKAVNFLRVPTCVDTTQFVGKEVNSCRYKVTVEEIIHIPEELIS